MTITGRVSLDGETFLIKIDETLGEPDGGFTYYPLTILHESSGMSRDDLTADSTQPDEVFLQYGFAEDLFEFYRRLYGRTPEADSFDVIGPAA